MTEIIDEKISESLLRKYNATELLLQKGDFVFKEDEYAKSFFYLVKGELKMFNYHDDGSEFIQRVFSPNQSFGEPPLFNGKKYPASAVALKECFLLKLPQEAFFELLKDNYKVHLNFTKTLANRLFYKAMMAAELSSNHSPEKRVLKFLNYLKAESKEKGDFMVSLTRQQIADVIGLRVETVIKAVKKLEKKNELKVMERKIQL